MQEKTADLCQSAPLVDGAPLTCHTCGAPLCLRKQMINLAVGNVEDMFCLLCLAKDSSQSPQELLAGLSLYINKRDCLRKEWARYTDVSYCPDRLGCLPDICFATHE
jgi:hypothetical protein